MPAEDHSPHPDPVPAGEKEWTVEADERVVVSRKPRIVVGSTNGFYPLTKAQARLIAAAPALYEALRVLEAEARQYPSCAPECEAARAALRLATGGGA